MTTIKVTVEAAAAVANTVRRLKAQGRKDMTADKLIRLLMASNYPDDARLIFGDDVETLAAEAGEQKQAS